MSSKYLGLPFDIHGGGMDLRFPHHENEIAQAEAATGKSFARYWIHVGLLTVRGEKMSKSLGNFITIRDLITKWDPEVIRMFFAQTQYRSPPDYKEKALDDVAKSLERLHRVKERLEAYAATTEKKNASGCSSASHEFASSIACLSKEFTTAMDDDFNTPKAFAALFEFVNRTNKYFEEEKNPSTALCQQALQTLVRVGSVLTLFQEPAMTYPKDETALVRELQMLCLHYNVVGKDQTVPRLLDALLDARVTARKEKHWAVADGIRRDLEKFGFEIQDTAHGPVWRKR
jgi:cysteinyl-tRNA synthetase